MLDDRYHFTSSRDLLTFEFLSIGPKGIVTKVVHYTEIDVAGIYNLGFGDKNATSGSIDDLTVTNNNDSKKVLATVAQTLFVFTDKNPDAIVVAMGSTQVRTRLYQMAIANNLVNIEENFLVLGLKDYAWEPFKKNVRYDAFSIRRKTINLLHMKEEKVKYNKKKLPKNITYSPELDGRYDNEPLFKEKADRANEIIRKAGVPKF